MKEQILAVQRMQDYIEKNNAKARVVVFSVVFLSTVP